MCMTIPDVLKIDKVANGSKSGIAKLHAEELANRVRAMKREEMELVLDNIPIELCFQRIEKELAKNKAFVEAINNAMDILGARD